ncbi:hypothetical protein LJC71_03305 [Desulfosarcina sp. OttesenSCG-928-A07]|nr:hypothetical protein [Desulfosarcina sp. OttesenSCG-928-A07]
MKNTFFIMIVALLLSYATAANAQYYEFDLTRKGNNIYKADGQDIIIHTQYCFVYAESEEAILKPSDSGDGGDVFFFESKDKCDVKAVFGPAKQEPGTHMVTVTKEASDWYEAPEIGSYIKTLNCSSTALGEAAFLILEDSGSGRLQFKSGNNCMVEGVYTKVRF